MQRSRTSSSSNSSTRRPFRTKAQRRKAQRNWRERHPLLAAWHQHLACARRRGIRILWDFDEFSAWCFETGYHVLRCEGFQIHRRGDGETAYCARNCICIPREENGRLGGLYRWRRSA